MNWNQNLLFLSLSALAFFVLLAVLRARIFRSKTCTLVITLRGDAAAVDQLKRTLRCLSDKEGVVMLLTSEGNVEFINPTQNLIDELGKMEVEKDKLNLEIFAEFT